jgi:methyl-accepting chemotaxis protein
VLASVCWYATARVTEGLAALESAVGDQDEAERLKTGIHEFDQSAQTVGKCAARWEKVAADTRRQAHDFQAIMQLISLRAGTVDPNGNQFRELLAGLGAAIHSQLSQIERGVLEIEGFARSINEGTEAQGQSVIKTTSVVEQLSGSIESVSSNAALSATAVKRIGETAAAAMSQVRELIAGMESLRTESQTCEKKLRGLCDPTQQIASIVGTVSDIAARTNLLALNASIESIRAGEHGRGFAIVADEVRKLAEQASDATREIASLIDGVQLVTQESIRGIAREREKLEGEATRAVAAETALQQICAASDADAKQIQRIIETSAAQLQMAQDVVLAAEKVSKIAKSNRGSLESLGWTVKSLSKINPQFQDTIERLRQCSGSSTPAVASEARSISLSPPLSMPALGTELVALAGTN